MWAQLRQIVTAGAILRIEDETSLKARFSLRPALLAIDGDGGGKAIAQGQQFRIGAADNAQQLVNGG
jgi:hypothetical protein